MLNLNYLKRYLITPIPSIASQFCRHITVMLEAMRGDQIDAPKLIQHVKEFQEKIDKKDNAHFRLCLLALRDYINSRDFHFLGKYHSRSWLWGAIRYVSDSPTLVSFNLEINKMINVSPRFGLWQDISQLMFDGWQLLKKAWNFAVENKIFTLVVAFSSITFFWPRAKTQAQTETILPLTLKTEQDQVPEFRSPTRLICATAPMNDAEIILFGERHDDSTQKMLNQLLTKNITQTGTLKMPVLFEGAESLKKFSCEIIPGLAGNNQLECMGWEDMEEYKKSDSIDSLKEKMNKEYKEYENHFSQYKILQDQKVQLQNRSKILDSRWKNAINRRKEVLNLDQQMQLLLEIQDINLKKEEISRTEKNVIEQEKSLGAKLTQQSNQVNQTMNQTRATIRSPDVVRGRNKKGLIRTLETLRQQGHTQIVAHAGAAHFFKERPDALPPYTCDFNAEDEVYDLRNYLRDKKHYIAFMK